MATIKKKMLPVIIFSLIIIISIIIVVYNTVITKTPYDNVKIEDFDNYKTDLYDVEQDILNYILENTDINKDMVKNVEYIHFSDQYNYRSTLKIELDDNFDSISDSEKQSKANAIRALLFHTWTGESKILKIKNSYYCLKFRFVEKVQLVTNNHKSESDESIDNDIDKINSINTKEIQNEMKKKGFYQNVTGTFLEEQAEYKRKKAIKDSNSIANSTTNSNNTNTTLDNPEDKISLSISPSKFSMHEKYADTTVYVHNNSNKDIAYIEVDIFIKDKNGKIVKSDWTNDSSTIKSGASQQIDTTLKDVYDGYTVDVKLRKVRFE